MSTTTITFWVISVIVAVLIGRKKNLEPVTYWLMGLLLNWIGVVILLLMKPQLPKAPEGMCAVKCVRCNSVQNIALGHSTVQQCFQCQAALPRPWQDEYLNRIKP